MTKVFIVILNWNRPLDTLECVNSLDKCQLLKAKCQIIIVDNGSVDNSVGQFEKLDIKHHPLKIIRNHANLGYAAGNNVGVRYALKEGADFILILNNDTIVEKNLLTHFLEKTQENSNIGILSPKVYFTSGFEFHKNRYKKKELGKVIWAAGGNFDWNNFYGINRGVDEVDKGQYDKSLEVDFAPGTCIFITRRVLEEIGLFDESYFMYLEDVDLSFRAKNKGWNIKYLPQAVIWHKVARSSGIGSGLNDYFISRNRLLLGLRYAKLRTKFALFRESIKLLLKGRKLQRIGVRDFYLGNLGKGSWK